jgi:RES domain-containing protein
VRITAVSDRALVRLIPATYHKPPALHGLVDSDDEMAVLAEIEGLTSARLKAEQGRNAWLDIRDLAWARRKNDLRLYGQSHINAAYTYTRTGGNRFNDETRGAWYCSWETLTSVAEVAWHRTRELEFIGIFKDRARYVELLADFIGDFPDITDEPGHLSLHPDPATGYPVGQALAQALRRDGKRGLVYPSVRRTGHRCLVVFDPNAIQNVRPGASWDLEWSGTPEWSVAAA